MSSYHDNSPTTGYLRQTIEARLRGKAKPIGSLGRLEDLALQLGLIAGSPQPRFGKSVVVVFAGDHGFTSEGITAYPSEVTHEVAKLIVGGNAGISVLARAAGVDIRLVDCGLLKPLAADERSIDFRIGSATRNALCEPAMTHEECEKAIKNGRAIDAGLANEGFEIIGYGEVGIGNTSAAALLAHVVTGQTLKSLTGPGAGVPPRGLDHKLSVLEAIAARAKVSDPNPARRALEAFRQFGGFEMATMAGAMLAAAKRNCVVVVDGFISTAVALAVVAMEPCALRNCVFAHCSAEPGHRLLLDHLKARPLLELDMRLGEGSGASLAIPIIRAAEAILRDMADLPGEHPK